MPRPSRSSGCVPPDVHIHACPRRRSPAGNDRPRSRRRCAGGIAKGDCQHQGHSGTAARHQLRQRHGRPQRGRVGLDDFGVRFPGRAQGWVRSCAGAHAHLRARRRRAAVPHRRSVPQAHGLGDRTGAVQRPGGHRRHAPLRRADAGARRPRRPAGWAVAADRHALPETAAGGGLRDPERADRQADGRGLEPDARPHDRRHPRDRSHAHADHRGRQLGLRPGSARHAGGSGRRPQHRRQLSHVRAAVLHAPGRSAGCPPVRDARRRLPRPAADAGRAGSRGRRLRESRDFSSATTASRPRRTRAARPPSSSSWRWPRRSPTGPGCAVYLGEFGAGVNADVASRAR